MFSLTQVFIKIEEDVKLQSACRPAEPPHSHINSFSLCLLFTHKQQALLTADVLTCQNTGVTHYLHDGCVPFRCAGVLAHLPVSGA